MNKKIIFVGTIIAIAAISIPMAINQTQPKIHGTFIIQNYDDLKDIVGSLSNEMWEEQIFLEMKDIHQLVTSDPEVDLIRLYPNNMDGTSGGKGTWDDGYSLNRELADGSRTWEEFSKNGTLLKSIKIYDEQERDILIILK